jgi:PAS domain S-box-containing protein
MGESAFAAEIAELQQRLAELQHGGERVELEILVQDLGTAVEELRVADEEVRAQQEEVARLLETEQLLRWRHDRMLSTLPVPVLTTNNTGQLRSVNPAAAALIGIPVSHLLRKPLFTLVEEGDRPALRTLLMEAVRRGVTRTGRVRMSLRGRTVDTSVSISPMSQMPDEVTWLLLGRPVSTGSGHPIDAGGAPVADALAGLFGLTGEWSDQQAVLQQAVYIVAESLGGRAPVSLVLGPPSAPTAVASSSTEAQALDASQLATDGGPTRAAFESGQTVVTADVHRDPRWSAGDHDSSAASVVAVPLGHGDGVGGVLTTYLADELEATPELVERVEILSAGVSSVLRELGLRSDLEALGDDMRAALRSRSLIEQAKGIVMATKHCTADEAFQHLVRLSNTNHLKLRDVAGQIVGAAGG